MRIPKKRSSRAKTILSRVSVDLRSTKTSWLKFATWETAVGPITTLLQRFRLGSTDLQRL